MSATVAAALKKIAVALLSDRKILKNVLMVILVVIVALLMPTIAVLGIFSGSIELDVDALQSQVVANLTDDDRIFLTGIETTMDAIADAMEEREMSSRVREAQVLYILALSEQARQPDFASRLAGCFSEGQSDAQLIAAVNREFGTNISVEDFTHTLSNIRAQYIDTSHYIDPSTKNNLDLVQWAIAAEKAGWGYVWGTYGRVLTESSLEAKLQQYPEAIGEYEDFIRANWIGKRTADCVGLIKGYGWFDPETGDVGYAVNGMPDIDANRIYEYASEKGHIDTIPEIPGLLVWQEGHVGIYIGGGEVIEARGTRYGVVRTRLNARGWEGWAKIPYISYIDESSEEPTEVPTEESSESRTEETEETT